LNGTGLTETELAFFKQNAVFCGMEEAFFPRALVGARLEAFCAGAVVMAAGERMRALGVIVEGTADVYKRRDKNAQEGLLMSVLIPSSCFGAATMFLSDAEAATEVRTRRGCKVLFFPEEWLKALMRENFAFAERYIAYLTERVHFLTDRIESIASPTAAEKLYSHLAQSAQNGIVHLPHGMRALAGALGISRASLYRVMDELEEQGRIKREGNTIYLL
jgi:CRP-like cAMP-binding protein